MNGNGEAEPPDRLTELASSNAVLRVALTELRGGGITDATAEALVSVRADDVDLSEFLSLVVREVHGSTLFGLALTLVPCVARRGSGHEALDYCLQSGRLADWEMASVGMHMRQARTPEAVVWFHSRLTSVIRSDPYYHSFLVRHVDIILDRCFDEMVAYLLHPNRGPRQLQRRRLRDRPHPHRPTARTGTSLDRVDPRRLLRPRAPGGIDGCQHPVQHPEPALGRPRLARIVEAIHTHVHLQLKSSSEEQLRDGLYHLVAMVDKRYRGAEHVVTESVSRIYDVPVDFQPFVDKLRDALQALVEYLADPSPSREEHVSSLYREVADADRNGLTGHWRAR